MDALLPRRLTRATLAVLAVCGLAGSGSAHALVGGGCAPPAPVPAGLKRPAKSAPAPVLADFILALPQHKPCDVDLFSSNLLVRGFPLLNSGIYPEAAAMAPDTQPEPTAGQMRSQLQQYLKEQFGSDQAGIQRALAVFDNPQARRLIPAPKLRAAFAAMTGTAFEPTIGYFLTSGHFTGIQYGATVPDTNIAETVRTVRTDPASEKRTILAKDRYEGEPFYLWIPALGQEIQHTPAPLPNGVDETFLNWETGLVINEVLAKHAEVAYLNTELTRRMNDYAMEFLNSRHPGSAENVIIAPDGLGLYPGSTVDLKKDFWSNYGAQGLPPTPAPSVATAVFKGILAPRTKIPQPLDYGQATAALAEHVQDPLLPPEARLRNSVLLQLVTVDEIAKDLQISKAAAIREFQLQPILNIIKRGRQAP